MSNLQGKVAIVTGASRGMGAAITQRLAGDGANVVVNYIGDRAAAEVVVGKIAAAGGTAIAEASWMTGDLVGVGGGMGL